MEKLISEFLNYLKSERNRSLHTVANYKFDLQLFSSFALSQDASLTWQTVDSDLIRAWMEDMMDGGSRATSINRRLSSLRSFFRFALMRGLVEADPAHLVRGPKKGKPLPQYLHSQEMDRLLDDIPWADTLSDLRARTIILTFYSTGLRLSELVQLDDSSLDFSLGQLKVLGKRSKERIVPFGRELSEALALYVSRRDKESPSKDGALFVGDDGGRMKAFQVRNLVRSHLSKVTSMKKRSPHVLRHSFATAMLNNSADLEGIRSLLGHESISTTKIYTHTTIEQLQKVYRSSHPRGDTNEAKKEEKIKK